MTELDDFLILPVSALDQLLAKSSSEPVPENPISCLRTPSEFSYIDEQGLMPGSSEGKTIAGYLTHHFDQAGFLRFADIQSQQGLHDLKLKANGTELSYQLDESQQHLIATADGNKIFDAQLKQDGTYLFTLHQPIDRLSAPNLVTDNWQTVNEESASKMSQQLQTEPHTPYQFTLHYLPGLESSFEQLQIYWDNQLLQTIQPSHHDARGYTFSVEGAHHDNHTLLEIVGLGAGSSLSDFIQDISVTSSAQFQLPIDFAVLFTGGDQSISENGFTINVTTTPAIEIDNQKQLDIFYEQSVYQTIIVNDENANANPLTTINLDSLFKQLSIEQDNRVVEVVQRTEDGIATNVYEIKISDKAQPMEPITIADVQLSFPGGNGGMAVFERHIAIDEGSARDALPSPLDMI